MTKKQILDDLKYFNSKNQKLIIWKSFDRLDESIRKTDLICYCWKATFKHYFLLKRKRLTKKLKNGDLLKRCRFLKLFKMEIITTF